MASQEGDPGRGGESVLFFRLGAGDKKTCHIREEKRSKKQSCKVYVSFYIYYAEGNLWKAARRKTRERGVPDGTGFLFFNASVLSLSWGKST